MKFLIAVVLVLATCASVESRGKIFGGNVAPTADFPYQVIVFVPTVDKMGDICGGSVISNSWILTAAHCLAGGNKSETKVLLGLNKNHQFTLTVKAINAIMHEKFIVESTKVHNDIGLVNIPFVQYNAYIRPLALSHTSSIVNQTVTVAGFGLTGTGTSFSRKLKVTTMMVMDNKSCKKLLGESFPNTEFCTNDIYTSACAGDAGGPVTIGSGLNLQQVGLVSYVLKEECVAGNPTSYTLVSSYVPWINGKTGLTF